MNELQELLDGPDQEIRLNGRTFDVDVITLSTQHSGKRLIGPGKIRRILPAPGAQEIYGLFRFIQGRKWGAINYPAGEIDFAFEEGIEIDGGFNFDSGLQAYNDLVAQDRRLGANLVTTITNRAGAVSFTDCRFINSGSSAIAGGFRELVVERCSFEKITQHCVGIRGFGGSRSNLSKLDVQSCGNVFDLHNEENFYSEALPDRVEISDVFATGLRGRTKLNGNNFEAKISNYKALQTSNDRLNRYPAIDVAKNPRRFELRDFFSSGFLTSGIRIGPDNNSIAPVGTIIFDNVLIEKALAPIECQKPMALSDACFVGHYQRYKSGRPTSELNVVDLTTGSAQQWADELRLVKADYELFNSIWETAFVPTIWAPEPILDLLKT